MAEALALIAASCFGVTHFVNGLVSRRHSGVTVAVLAQLGGTALSVVLASLAPHGNPTGSAFLWAVTSGLGTGIGVAFLYRAMSRGPMSVVAPVSDLAGVALPVLAGIVVLGEHPSPFALAGIVLALVAIALVSRGAAGESVSSRRVVAGVPDALVAGIGFAAQYIGMARIPADAGLWPIASSRIVSVVIVVGLAAILRAPLRLPAKPGAAAVCAGAVGTLAIVLFWTATGHGLLAVTVVLAALYPAIPVLLALTVLHEKVTAGQTAGLVGVAAAVVLISLP